MQSAQNVFFLKIEKIENTKNAENLLTSTLIKRIDHVAFGCYREYTVAFIDGVNEFYEAFRVTFNLKIVPNKSGNM